MSDTKTDKKTTLPEVLSGIHDIPKQLEPTLRRLCDLLDAVIVRDSDYDNVMTEVAALAKETGILAQGYRDARDEAIGQMVDLENELTNWEESTDKRVVQAAEAIRGDFVADIFDNGWEQGYDGSVEDIAFAISELTGHSHSLCLAAVYQMNHSKGMPGNEDVIEVLRDLLRAVESGEDNE